jgi:hypothetical protein
VMLWRKVNPALLVLEPTRILSPVFRRGIFVLPAKRLSS